MTRKWKNKHNISNISNHKEKLVEAFFYSYNAQCPKIVMHTLKVLPDHFEMLCTKRFSDTSDNGFSDQTSDLTSYLSS